MYHFFQPKIDFNYFIEECKKGVLPNVKESLSEMEMDNQEIINTRDENGMSGYMYAVENNRINVVSYFLYKYKCNSFLKNKNGYSALLIASEKGFVDCLKYILDLDKTIKSILDILNNLTYLYNKKNKIYDELDILLNKFGENDPRVRSLYVELNYEDDKEKKNYAELKKLDFEQIILCFDITSNLIVISLLNNTFGPKDNLVYIYNKMTSGEVL